MNRSLYFDLCEEHLCILCVRIEVRGKLNLLNLHIHCEDFYLRLMNLLFGYQLENVNATTQNVEGIDLVDSGGKIVMQVSAKATKDKITSALSKDLSAYAGHGFVFVSIAKDASALRGAVYANPHKLTFAPKSDIHDVRSMLNVILHMDIAQQQEIYALLKKELEPMQTRALHETNLAAVISIVAQENLAEDGGPVASSPFNLDDKLAFNQLNAAAEVIEDYKIHHHRVNRIYAAFDAEGKNKSKSVLDTLRLTYLQLSGKYDGDELYFQVVEHVVAKVRDSANYVAMPLDELELCVNIVVVDAFIRCKIFRVPIGDDYAVA